MSETRRSYCGLCHLHCGLLLEIENGIIVAVKGTRITPSPGAVSVKEAT